MLLFDLFNSPLLCALRCGSSGKVMKFGVWPSFDPHDRGTLRKSTQQSCWGLIYTMWWKFRESRMSVDKRWRKCSISKWMHKQEGQHPLTGQHAANFRLLANQWAERRLVTQWRHGCRAMRRSVCNAGATNAGRSLCVQISRERSYPLPTYWYHSKGNWLRYNLAADSFYIMKLCSRLFVLYCRNWPKDDKFSYFIPILRKLGAA